MDSLESMHPFFFIHAQDNKIYSATNSTGATRRFRVQNKRIGVCHFRTDHDNIYDNGKFNELRVFCITTRWIITQNLSEDANELDRNELYIIFTERVLLDRDIIELEILQNR